jgi:DNA-binding transcriptional MocR family regulator
MVEVPVDGHGLSAITLHEALESWPEAKIESRPKVLYTTPHGSNPSGLSCPLKRKLEVLKVCKDYGVLIVEGKERLSSPAMLRVS